MRLRSLLAGCIVGGALLGCAAAESPRPRLAGVLLDGELDETSGLAAARVHDNALWLIEDGGNPARLHAASRRGRPLASFPVAGVTATDWEDLAAFELDGRPYLLIADTGDNGGLRRTLLLHVVPEPRALRGRRALRPAWSIAFRWPDGPRDCEAVAVDAARGEVLLLSKKRRPVELFTVPLRPRGSGLQTARRVATLPSATRGPGAVGSYVTSADLSPDGLTLAVLTYRDILRYSRKAGEPWNRGLMRPPHVVSLPAWIHQAEALGWAADGRGLFVTGEFSPAPIAYLPLQD
jgi:hypothetical protein